jgi:hypothetical protein
MIVGNPYKRGWGTNERDAIRALAVELKRLAQDIPPRGGLSAFGQVRIAAERLPIDELTEWLAERADDAMLADRAHRVEFDDQST